MWALEKTVLGGHMVVGQGLMQTQQAIGARAWKVWGNAEWTSLPFRVGVLDSTSRRASLVILGESHKVW